MNSFAWRKAAWLLRSGGLIAYPTESVYGLGCDPCNEEALLELLAVKRRDWRKGLILVAAEIDQLKPWLAPLSDAQLQKVTATWPGPHTWLLPVASGVSPLICGQHATIAVRVSSHPVIRGICHAFGGAMISTSANISHKQPAKSAAEVRMQFGNQIDYVVAGSLGDLQQPTTIRDATTDAWIRR